MELIEACRRLIAIDTSPDAGSIEAAEFLAQYAESQGLTATLHRESFRGLDQANLVVRTAQWASDFVHSTEQELVLQTHIDTPDPGSYSVWTETDSNPFQATIKAGKIFGLGAADCKLDFIAKILALAEFQRANPTAAARVACAATFGEEIGMQGAVRLVRRKMVRPKAVLVGEPTDFKIVNAGKGYAFVQIEIPFSQLEIGLREQHDLAEQTTSQSRAFIGKAAHSSDPNQGESAIAKMLQSLQRLPAAILVLDADGGHNPNTVPAHAFIEIDAIAGDLPSDAENHLMRAKLIHIGRAIARLEQDFSQVSDARFSPSCATLNLGTIRTTRESVRLTGCVRMPPGVPERTFQTWIEGFRTECEKIQARLSLEDVKSAYQCDLTSSQLGRRLAQVCAQLGLDSSPAVISVTNEASVFSRFGMDCLVWGPGQGVGNSHTPSEYVRVEDLEKAIEVYRMLIEAFSFETS